MGSEEKDEVGSLYVRAIGGAFAALWITAWEFSGDKRTNVYWGFLVAFSLTSISAIIQLIRRRG